MTDKRPVWCLLGHDVCTHSYCTKAWKDGVEEMAFIKRLVRAWDCCGTCAGGVLAEHDRGVKQDIEAKVRALCDEWDNAVPDSLEVLKGMRRCATQLRAALSDREEVQP